MARKDKQEGEVNKSAAIRDAFAQNPNIKAAEVIAALAAKGIKVSSNLVYLVKGKLSGQKKRRRKIRKAAASAVTASGQVGTPGRNDVVKTILKVKTFAAEVGGLASLKKLVDALSE